ncbi:MAG: 3-oxoacyl-ACP reductase FabG [Planctomycetes bacterium]|nr:3-oxoacyl-ACP reductase FabG [Planctomycetota bacterium]
MRLKDRVALITGAGGGIGEAVAVRFAKEGARVVINDVNPDGANKVADTIKSAGGEAIVIKADVTNKPQVEAMVKEIVGKYGKLDIIVNNAGINRDAMVKKMDENQWDQVININLKGTFLVCQAGMMPMMEANYGRIINTSSIGSLGNIGQANYAASKAGVIGLTLTLALELAKYKINVNCVAPGATTTPMTKGIPEPIAKAIADRIPLKRFADPSEIANMHLFLASDEASYVTGQVIFVDGGISVGI